MKSERGEALQIIKELEEMSGANLSQAAYIANVYAALNEKDLSLDVAGAWLSHGSARSLF